MSRVHTKHVPHNYFKFSTALEYQNLGRKPNEFSAFTRFGEDTRNLTCFQPCIVVFSAENDETNWYCIFHFLTVQFACVAYVPQ